MFCFIVVPKAIKLKKKRSTSNREVFVTITRSRDFLHATRFDHVTAEYSESITSIPEITDHDTVEM